MTRIALLLALLPPLAVGCGDAPAEPETGMSAAARTYLQGVLQIMEFNSINRFIIQWPTFREAVRERAGNAQTTADTYPAIRFAIDLLGDNHSFFRPPTLAASTVAATRPTSAHLLRGDYGYVYVPAFSGSASEAQALADSLQSLIESIDAPGRCGWVVDLRWNTGGNMWPMLAGVGPILGHGVAGHFVDPDPSRMPVSWGYDSTQGSWSGTSTAQAVEHYSLHTGDPAVAVLTDERTASSGEAITIAFRDRPRTRSFGEPTFGVSTANRGFPLSDGAVLVLTVSTMADRNLTLYGLEVPPDDTVVTDLESPSSIDPTTGVDAAVEAALNWLETNGDCASP